jgi:hypothetical protein
VIGIEVSILGSSYVILTNGIYFLLFILRLSHLIGRATFFIDVKGIIRGVCTKNIDFRRVVLFFRSRPFVVEVDARLTSELIFALLSAVLLLGRNRTVYYYDVQLQCAYQVRRGDVDLGRKGGQVGCRMWVVDQVVQVGGGA